MGKLKNYYFDYLSSEDFDLMFDDEYEEYLKAKEEYELQYEAEKEAYEEALSLAK